MHSMYVSVYIFKSWAIITICVLVHNMLRYFSSFTFSYHLSE